MNVSNLLIFMFLLNSALKANAQVFPPVIQKTNEFHLKNADKPLSGKLEEYLSFGEHFPAFLLVTGEPLPFAMEKPTVDSCGAIHFKGREVLFEEKVDRFSPEYRFIEGKSRIDVSCDRVPFQRCGYFRSIETDKAGDYLLDELTLYRSECHLRVVLDSGIEKFFEVRLSATLPKD